VSERGWDSARIDELEDLRGPGSLRWRPVRRRFGLSAFGMNAYTATEAGQDVVEEHTERSLGHEEVYVVLTGRARFRLDGEDLDAPAGTIVAIRDPAVKRYARAEEAGTTVLAVGGRPGLHEPSAWEWSFAGLAYGQQGDHERGIATIEEGLAEKGEDGPLLYNLACLEALAGRPDDALEHLRRAVELRPEAAAWAQDDDDLAAIRDDPRFPTAPS
jgi:tetratricopeptide (TPR) repeat protein